MTETFEVEYSGPWKEDIEECVRRVETDHRDDEPDLPADDPYTRLILELPEEAPVVEVEQLDA